jgi:hypothetical protein
MIPLPSIQIDSTLSSRIGKPVFQIRHSAVALKNRSVFVEFHHLRTTQLLWHKPRNGPIKAKQKAKGREGPQEEKKMSRQLIKGMTMLLLVVALAFVTAVASAYGQSNSSNANIPFEFVAGGKTLPAGHYQVASATDGGQVVRIRATESKESTFSLTMGILNRAPAEKGKLVFRRYGNKYFLAEIWQAGDRDGRQMLKSKEERAVERELASIKSNTRCERIEIALAR